MKYIRLTEIDKVLNEAAQQRLRDTEEEAIRLSKLQEEEGDGSEEGSYEWFIKMGIPVPEDVKPDNKVTELNISFSLDEDYDIYFDDILLDRTLIQKVSRFEDFENSSILFLSNGDEILVKESIEELEPILNK